MTDNAMSSTSLATDNRNRVRQPLVFGGIPEADGWILAPITPRDRVHFRVDHELPLEEFRNDLPDGVTVSYDQGDGLYRVDGVCGSASVLADWIRAWAARRDERVVGRGAVRIHVREAARDHAAAAGVLHGGIDGLRHGLVERVEAIPRASGLERVADDAHRDERALEVRRVEEGLLPDRGVVRVVIDRRRTARGARVL